MSKRSLIALMGSILTVLVWHQAAVADRPITVVGRPTSTVTTPVIRLGDLATIAADVSRYDEAVIGLQKLTLRTSPPPGQEIRLAAEEVLGALRAAGVNLNDVTYTFPKVMNVTRAGRVIAAEEIRATINQLIQNEARDQAIRQLFYREDQYGPPGAREITAVLQQQRENGRRKYLISVATDGEVTNQFPVDVVMDEWIQVPTARRPLGKGEVVSDSDLVMARLNMQQLPKDAAMSGESIVGLSLKSDLSYGDVFRRDALVIPPIVLQGAPVVLRFARAGFEATATGSAMEDGIRGAEIRVRNENSKRVVKGIVKEPGIVEVLP